MIKSKGYYRISLENRLVCFMMNYPDGVNAKKKVKLENYLDDKIGNVVNYYVRLLKKIFLLILLVISLKSDAQNPDINLVKNINPHQPNSGFWKFTSGSAYFVSAAVPFCMLAQMAMAKDHSVKFNAFKAFGPIIIELVISESMKDILKRKRPGESYPDLISPYRDVTGRSFPSGHTSLVFATAAGLSIQYKKWYVVVPAYTYASLVGYSRIYLGVHYPSDVIAGSIVGVSSAYLSYWLNKKLFSTRRSKSYSTNK